MPVKPDMPVAQLPVLLTPPPGRFALCTRRQWLALTLGAGAANALALPARALQFPRDHGSHPDLHTEWWYLTGHVQAEGRLWGFQVTFFRSRVDATQGMQSAFAARQLLFAHAALTDIQGQRLHHDQRIARAGFGVAQASESDTAVKLRDWSLARTALPDGTQRAAPGSAGQSPITSGSRYLARVEGDGFGLDLRCDTAQPPLLQGRQGLSRKGPEAAQASYYYSQPQLAVSGAIVLNGRRMAIESSTTDNGTNRAWLDHEWSDALMHPDAVGWDWIGMNLYDGSALTAFRLRRADGSTLWTGGSFRPVRQETQVFANNTVVFAAERHWSSPLERRPLPGAMAGDNPRWPVWCACAAGRPGARQQQLNRGDLLGRPVGVAQWRRRSRWPGLSGNDGIQKAAALVTQRPSQSPQENGKLSPCCRPCGGPARQ